MKTMMIGAVLAVAGVAGTANGQSFTALGDLPGGSFYSQGSSISADGKVVCGYSSVGTDERAFVWTASGGMVQLSGQPANLTDSKGYGLTGDGQMLVGQMETGPNTSAAFRWTAASGMVAMPSWVDHSFMLGLRISHDGGAVAGSCQNSATFVSAAYRWTSGGGYQQIPLLAGSNFAVGYGLSADGSTVVGYCSVSGDDRAFRWTQATGTVYLGDLPGSLTHSSANSCSYDGKVVVGSSYGVNGDEPFRWTQATGMVGLGNFVSSTPNGYAAGCSADGSVVIGTSRLGNGGSDYEAFIWDAAHGLRSIKSVLASVGVVVPAGWKLRYAQDISYDGSVIVGTGENPQGNTEGWVAKIKRTCVGDLNGDGFVNTADLTIFLGNFGKATIPLLGGDLSGNGVVNTQDLTQFLGVFGDAC